MKKQLSYLMALLLFPILAFAQTGSIQGKIMDGSSRQPLVAVNVTLDGQAMGTASGPDGSYDIADVSVGSYTLVAEFIGYEAVYQTDVIVRKNRITFVNIDLYEAVISGEAVTITGGYFQKKERSRVLTSLSKEEIRRSPGTAGEITRVLTALPSVASRGENSQDIVVRGGSPIENGFYVDNIPIPQIAHFTTASGSSNGPVGILNTDLIDNVDFYNGGFSSRFGDRMSAVIDVSYREGNREVTDAQFDVNFVGFGGVVDGPLGGGKGSWLISGRRSYLDIIADAINAGGAPRFEDVQGKLVFDISPTNKLTFLNIFGNNAFNQDQEDSFDEGFDEYIEVSNKQNTSGANWFTLWNKKAWSNTAVSYTYKTHDIDVNNTVSGDTEFQNDFVESTTTVRHTTFLQPVGQLDLEVGLDYSFEDGTYDYRRLVADTSLGGIGRPIENRLDQSVSGSKFGGFLNATFQPVKPLSISLGIRGDYSSYNEASTVSPRLSASWQATSRLAFNASYGVFHQGLQRFLLSQDEEFEALDDMKSTHYVAGLEYLLTADTRLTIEVFNKDYENIPQAEAATSPVGPVYIPDWRFGETNWGPLNSNGEGYSRGVEVLVQKKLAEKFYGIVSGSFFRSRYTDFNGVERSRDYDNKYLFNVIGGYKPNNKWEFSVRWTYLGERPYTEINEAASVQTQSQRLFVDRTNEATLPAYHSLFFRSDRRFNVKGSTLIAYLSVWNAYNRENVDAFVWSNLEQRILKETQFSLLPIFGIEYEF
ncbi:MAG: TonB-dependent receptor [Calditrichia bacterium]